MASKGACVAKYIAMVVVVLVLTAAAYFGMAWYRTATNTPENVIASFTRDITDPEKPTYERLSSDLKKQYTESAWQQYTATFKGAAEPVQLSREQVEDTLNTYPDDSAPQRFVYKYRIQDRDYLASIIILKQGDMWLVDHIQGDYK